MKSIVFKEYMFKELKKDSVLGKELIDNYNKSTKKTLYNCYVKPSKLKREIYEKCLDFCKELNGKESKITSHSPNYFSFGFKVDNYLIYITYRNDYIIDLGE